VGAGVVGSAVGMDKAMFKYVMEANEKLSQVSSENVRAAIDKISDFQLSSGGFSYWPGVNNESDWGSSYAGHFLIEAKEKGYQINQSIFDNWVKYQRQTARRWTGTNYSSSWHRNSLVKAQAYRLYTLALAGQAQAGPMNRLRENRDLSGISRWLLAGAYALNGNTDAAKELVASLGTETENYDSADLYTFGSSLRDKAIILRVYQLLGEDDKAVPVLQYISEKLSSQSWYSTQTTAFALMAVSKFVGEQAEGGLNFRYSWDSGESMNAVTNKPLVSVNKSYNKETQTSLSVINNAGENIFVRLSLTGVPLAGNETSSRSNLGLSVDYRTPDGKAIDISSLEQGTDFDAIVTIRNPGTLGFYKDMALTRIFPSGWEIQNTRLFGVGNTIYDNPVYEDIRDDRVLSYFNLSAYSSVQYRVRLTASYAGKFYLPAISCEAMYRSDISGVIPGKWVEVTVPGN